MMNLRTSVGSLPIAITILALTDGMLHLSLRPALFGGPRPGRPAPGTRPAGAPPPGARPPGLQLPLPLTDLFVFNFVGYLVMVLLFWLAPRWLGARSWLIDIGFIIYTALATVAWLEIGKPN